MQDSEHQPSDFHSLESSSKPAAALPTAKRFVYTAAHPSHPDAPFAVFAIDPKWARETAKDVASYIRKGCIVDRIEFKTGSKLMFKWLDMSKEERAGLFDKRGNCIEKVTLPAAAQTTAQPDVQGDAK